MLEREEKESWCAWLCACTCRMNSVCRGEGWHKIITYKIIQCGALWSSASSPMAAWHLLHRDSGKAICFLQETWHHPSAHAAPHSCLGVTFLVVLQSQTDCYPTTCSNEASAAAQNETFVVLMVVLLSLVCSVSVWLLDLLCTCITVC